LRRNGRLRKQTNQVAVAHLACAYIRRSDCQALRAAKAALLPDFTGKCAIGRSAGDATSHALLLHCDWL